MDYYKKKPKICKNKEVKYTRIKSEICENKVVSLEK